MLEAKTHGRRQAAAGFALLEALVASVLFAGGMLALVQLTPQAWALTQEAYQRSQASWLAQAMMERMRSNPLAAAQGAYQGAYPLSGAPADCAAAGCDAVGLAQRDRQSWSDELVVVLSPQATAQIHCTAGTAGAPVYAGACRLEITWPGPSRVALPAERRLAWDF